jgi:hypothetical protein
MQAKTTKINLKMVKKIPAMNAEPATLFWSQFGLPQPDDESSSSQLLLGSILAASYLQRGGEPQNSLFWSQFGQPQPDNKCSSSFNRTVSKVKSYFEKITSFKIQN